MESEDYPFYQGLVFLLEHAVAELGYELTFSTDVSCNYFAVNKRISSKLRIWNCANLRHAQLMLTFSFVTNIYADLVIFTHW